MPRSSVRRSELPASDVTRGCAKIGADVSDERSTMAWPLYIYKCRKVAYKLSVILVGRQCDVLLFAAFRLF